MKGKGWFNESHPHALASRGVKLGREKKRSNIKLSTIQQHNVKPTINVAGGKAKYLTTEMENPQGRWNDSWAVKDGYYVIHDGTRHHVYCKPNAPFSKKSDPMPLSEKAKIEIAKVKKEIEELKSTEQRYLDKLNKAGVEPEVRKLWRRRMDDAMRKRYSREEKVERLESQRLSTSEMTAIKKSLSDMTTISTDRSLGSKGFVKAGYIPTLKGYFVVKGEKWTSFMKNVRGCGSMAGSCDIDEVRPISEEAYNKIKEGVKGKGGARQEASFMGASQTTRGGKVVEKPKAHPEVAKYLSKPTIGQVKKDILKRLQGPDFKMSKEGGNGRTLIRKGNLVIQDPYYYGGMDKLNTLTKEWGENGTYGKWFKENYGVKFKVVGQNNVWNSKKKDLGPGYNEIEVKITK